MPETNSPWKRNAPSPRGYLRFAVWIAVVLAGVGGIWALSSLFPGGTTSDYDEARLVNLLALLVIFSAVVVQTRRFHVRQAVRNVALWLAVVAVLVIGYTFQSELFDIGLRVRSALIPGYAVSTGANEMVLSESDGGNFFVYGSVNGARVKFLIDTGASDIVLSPDDARAAGIDTNSLNYSHLYETANGAGEGASATLANLTVGPINLENVDVSVDKAPMDGSLLGMAFLRRMKSFAIRDRRLYLRW